jgi:hypothetical protein
VFRFVAGECVQTGSGALPASYSVGTGGSFHGGKAAGMCCCSCAQAQHFVEVKSGTEQAAVCTSKRDEVTGVWENFVKWRHLIYAFRGILLRLLSKEIPKASNIYMEDEKYMRNCSRETSRED